MGVVYLAEHGMIGRKAAVKVLAKEVAGDPEAVSRFFTEARSVNQIRHPNIVEVTDLGQVEERPYIVMEYLEGETLADRLAREPKLPAPAAIHIARQVASALGAAHQLGMVHRDLKPANIFLRQHDDYPDFVKVLDFGITKLMSPSPEVGHHTQVGAIMGTPAYMSPEQCLGETTLDHRSDIYSLGVVVYLMVTGKLPFPEDSLGRLILAHVNLTPKPPAALNPAVPAELSAIVVRAMAKRPAERFATMRDLRRALEASIGLDGAATPEPVTRADSGPVYYRSGSSRLLTPGALPVVRGVADVLPASSQGAAAVSLRDRHVTPGALPVVRLPERRETPIGLPVVAPPPARGPTPLTLPAAGAAPAQRPTPPEPTTATLLGEPARGSDAEDASVARWSSLARERFERGELELPGLSASMRACLESLRRPGLSFAELAAVVEKDARLASMLIRLANSAAFPSRVPAKSLEQAIGRLGAQGMRQALIEIAARPVLEPKEPRVKELYRRPWARALGVAIACERIVGELGGVVEVGGKGRVEPAEIGAMGYLTGLLLDIGRPIVAQGLIAVERLLPPRAGSSLSEATLQRSVELAFRPVSAELARRWLVPDEVAVAIARSARYEEAAGRTLGAVVRFGAALTAREGLPLLRRGPGEATEPILEQGRRHLALDPKGETRAAHHLKERADLLATIRGGS
jgi:HD-like signal output (HDOD) protein